MQYGIARPAGQSQSWPDVDVWVCNKTKNPFRIQYAGRVYEFVPDRWVKLAPDVAFWMFAFDVRLPEPGINRSVHFGQTGKQPYWQYRIGTYGWYPGSEMYEAFAKGKILFRYRKRPELETVSDDSLDIKNSFPAVVEDLMARTEVVNA